jgi:hypothetical protein
MTLDDELLRKAIASGADLAEAERRMRLARAELHSSVRRLHLAGASLREIAQALGLSHQRVQQMVETAGGSWWGRVWRTRSPRREAVCTFCDRPPSEVTKLIAGPDVYVCDGCVARAERVLDGGTSGAFVRAGAGARARCSFCGTAARDRQRVVTPAATVCAACLAACRQILDGREPA